MGCVIVEEWRNETWLSSDAAEGSLKADKDVLLVILKELHGETSSPR